MRRGIIGGLVALAVGVQAGWAVPGFHPAVAELRGSSGAGHPDFALFLEEVGGQPELWFCSLDGESWKVASGVAATDAAFSPHGHYLAYIRRLPGPPADTKEAGRCPYPHQLWVARVDGSESRLVLEFPAVGRLQCPGEVGWSPDGERIYFGVAGSPTHREVWSVSKDGSDLRNHTWGWDFTVHPGGQISGITRGWIPFIYDPAGGDKVYVTDWGMIYHAFFSPTGEAFLAEVAGALVLIGWRAGEERVLLPARQVAPRGGGRFFYRGLEICWHPDGTGFAFTSGWDGDNDIYYYDLGTGEVRRLTDGGWDDGQPAFSPDGKYLAYTSRAPLAPRICILSLEEGLVAAREVAGQPNNVVWRLRGGG